MLDRRRSSFDLADRTAWSGLSSIIGAVQGWTDMLDGTVDAGASIDAGDSLGLYYLYQQKAPPPGNMGL
jgi:hypothetical protein